MLATWIDGRLLYQIRIFFVDCELVVRSDGDVREEATFVITAVETISMNATLMMIAVIESMLFWPREKKSPYWPEYYSQRMVCQHLQPDKKKSIRANIGRV